jgi:hypothetical protein
MNRFILLYSGLKRTPRLMRAPVTIPIVIKVFVTGASPLNYFLPKPYDGSFGFINFAAGPSRPAIKALAKIFGSEIPDM